MRGSATSFDSRACAAASPCQGSAFSDQRARARGGPLRGCGLDTAPSARGAKVRLTNEGLGIARLDHPYREILEGRKSALIFEGDAT
jgi:hypothetical protein